MHQSGQSPHPPPPPPGQPGPQPAPPGPVWGTSGLAVASLVLAVLSYVGLSLLASIPAVICGHLARVEIRRASGRMEGDALAVAGLILGYINIAIHVLGCLVAAVVFLVFAIGGALTL